MRHVVLNLTIGTDGTAEINSTTLGLSSGISFLLLAISAITPNWQTTFAFGRTNGYITYGCFCRDQSLNILTNITIGVDIYYTLL